MLFMAWSPIRRTNAGRFEVDHPGDYATFNSYHPTDATLWAARVTQKENPAGISHIDGAPAPVCVQWGGTESFQWGALKGWGRGGNAPPSARVP
jgi:hypothetical protein